MEDPKSPRPDRSGPEPARPAPPARPRKFRPGMNADKVAFLTRVQTLAEATKAERETY